MVVLFDLYQFSFSDKFEALLKEERVHFTKTKIREKLVYVIENVVSEYIYNFLLNNNIEFKHLKNPFILSNSELFPHKKINVADNFFGENNFSIIAGPCTVENDGSLEIIGSYLNKKNVKFMRGGAYKPRKSPYSFQGMGFEGIKLLKKVATENNLKIVTELLSIEQLEEAVEYYDVIQIGARNMHNYPLLRELGKINKPILLKRGLSASIDELLLSADYILAGGNEKVILCERGIKTFETKYRSTLDLGAVSILKKISNLPVIVDPSHAMGNREFVVNMALAGMCAGADGLLVEIHSTPDCAICDGMQSLTMNQFDELLIKLNQIAPVMNKIIN